jgi:predicted component of type VI protein secretion system
MTEEAERFLNRVRDVLEACGKGIVELQNGQEQFGNEMGVRAVKEFTPLHMASSANNVLEYLLDWRHGGPQRVQELVGLFADTMIHQVALINGMVGGTRALLSQLAPDEIQRRASGTWGGARALWNAFVVRHRELSSDDKALVEHLFGPDFARAYAEVGGEQAPGSDEPAT